MRQRLSDRSSHRIETLESRVLLHAGHEHTAALGIPPELLVDGHIPATQFLQIRPEFQGRNLWDAATFNPTGSEDRNDWLYDPHMIEDDLPFKHPDAPSNPSVGPEADAYPDLFPITAGSYLDPFIDQTEIPGHNLMRFSTAVANQGSGPAILISNNTGTPPAGSGLTTWINPDGTQNVLQQVYNWTGTSFTFSSYRQAGRMTWHSGHGHFHLEGYAQYRLLTNVGGNPGPVALRSNWDNSPAIGDKIGFCLINIITGGFTMTNGQSSTTLPGYNASGQPSTSCGFTQGIHVGEADVYDSIYDGQWIDVTGVPNGNYFLEVTLDAMNVIQETNETNNTVLVPYTLNTSGTPGGIQPDRFEPNNDFASATNLGDLGVQTQPGLTAHVTDEPDFFRFVPTSSGNGTVSLTIADRDMNLFLYNSAQTLLASSSLPIQGTTSNPTTETITYNFVAGQTYYIKATGFGSNQSSSGVSSNYALNVNVKPVVAASTPTPGSSEVGLVAGRFTVNRNGPTSSPLTVNIGLSGTATRGTDYNVYQDGVLITGSTITIGNEASNANLDIVPLTDSLVEGSETVILSIGSSANYVLGTSATPVIIDDVGPAVAQATQNWQFIPHSIAFEFTLDVAASIAASDFSVIDTGTNNAVPVQSFGYVAGTRTATLTFAGALPDGRYRATAIAAGITHAQGTQMASDYVFDFFVLAGDANHDAQVGSADFNILATNFGNPAGMNAALGDFDGDGDVDSADFNILASKFGYVLPGGEASRSGSTAAGFPPGGSGGIFGNGGSIGSGSDDDSLGDLLA